MNQFLALVAAQGALLVFLATLGARLGAPIPAAPFLIVAGGLAGSGQLSLWAAVGAALAGNVLGDGAWFLAGRRWGHRVMWLLCRISLSADTCVRRSEIFISRWGGGSLVAAKFVPGISLVAPPMAGALGMSNTRFLAYETAAALIWAGLLLGLGWVFRAQIGMALDLLADFGLVATALLLVALGAFVVWRYLRRRADRRAEGVRLIGVPALRAALAAEAPALTVIDVRGDDVRAVDPRTVPGARGISLRRLPHALHELPAEHVLVLFCDCPDDASARSAARLLLAAGRSEVQVLEGGLGAWMADEAARADPSDGGSPPAPALAAS